MKKDFDIKKVLADFVNECSKRLSLMSVIQFGSSTYSKDAHDIDLLLVSKKDIFPVKEILELREIIFSFEGKYSDVVFDFSGFDRKRKGKYSITSVFLGKGELEAIHNPHEIFLYKTLIGDKDKKILYGGNPFENKSYNLTKEHLFEFLVIEQKSALRKSLDDEGYLFESMCRLFKTSLRVLLIDKGTFKKKDLLRKFKENFPEIELPKNAKKILGHQLNKKDFEDILRFSEDCLRFLRK